MNHRRHTHGHALFAARLAAPLAVPLAALLLTAFAPAAHAQLQQPFDFRPAVYTKGDWALLPEWCIDSQDGPYGSPEGGDYMNKSPRAPRWVALMGRDFWHMHHYCRGLRNVLRLRGMALPPQVRTRLLQSTVSEFQYVLNNCGTTMPLLPEVYLKLGETYLMQENLPMAQEAFQSARELKPDYWPAYDRWIAVLIGLKTWDKARELTEEGLRQSPGQPKLKAHLATINAATGRRSSNLRAAAAQPGDAAR